jgi:phosphotriesterase-related protein
MDSRRSFIRKTLCAGGALMIGSHFSFSGVSRQIMTVNGPINPEDMGQTLIHEHILVDFIGAARSNPSRWNKDRVAARMLPLLTELREAGCATLVDCTPNHLGRDPMLLRRLAGETGLHIITNTGYYGGSDNKFLPDIAFTESAEQLSARWLREWEGGIENTDVKPGFIKISVNDEKLSPVSLKLIRAAAFAHLKSGLVVASHTGPYIPAKEQVDMLVSMGVSPSAFIWVHAQNEKDHNRYVEIARLGAWVSLDGLSSSNVANYVAMLQFMKKEKCLGQTLVSHDAGWYDPDKPNGGEIRGYTTMFRELLPALKKAGFADAEIRQLIVDNPSKAFQISIRKA